MERERAYVDASRYLKNRVSLFLALPLSKLAPLSLNARLREIGYAEGGSSPRSDVA
jgi:arsenate reductase